jgi:hypothetical protein
MNQSSLNLGSLLASSPAQLWLSPESNGVLFMNG